MKQKNIYLILLLLTLIISVLFAQKNETKETTIENQPVEQNQITVIPATENPQTSEKTYLVTKVIDGDTIEIEGGQKLRYIGVDTPETVDPRRAVGCFGKEASNKNKELVLNKQVRLEKDVSETDKYGRLLRYVYVGDIFVNKYLVEEGFAKASSYPPDIKFQEIFKTAQTFAINNSKGLWGAC